MATFGELAEQFNKAYALKSKISFTLHDGGHCMTGCGIGLAEELRIAALQYSLWDNGTLQRAFDQQRKLFKETTNWYKNLGTINAEENGLDKKEFQKLQLKTVPLSREEVAAFYSLGMDILKCFIEVTGKRYRGFGNEKLAGLDFSQFDFTKRVVDIKAALESPENVAVAQKSARLLHYNSIRKGRDRDVIPAAGLPWHGPLMKPYR